MHNAWRDWSRFIRLHAASSGATEGFMWLEELNFSLLSQHWTWNNSTCWCESTYVWYKCQTWTYLWFAEMLTTNILWKPNLDDLDSFDKRSCQNLSKRRCRLCVHRSEQQRGSTRRKGAERQLELELRWRRPGGDQQLHRTEEGLGDGVAALQTLHVQPLAEAAAAGGSSDGRRRFIIEASAVRIYLFNAPTTLLSHRRTTHLCYTGRTVSDFISNRKPTTSSGRF